MCPLQRHCSSPGRIFLRRPDAVSRVAKNADCPTPRETVKQHANLKPNAARSWPPHNTLTRIANGRVISVTRRPPQTRTAGEAVHETLWGTVGGAWKAAPPRRRSKESHE